MSATGSVRLGEQRPRAGMHDLSVLPPGRVQPVLRVPEARLAQPCLTVDPCEPAIQQLGADLLATQRVSPGCVGLAAPQVGVGVQVFSLDVSTHPKAGICHGTLVLANAQIVQASRWQRGREGCMSVPDLTGEVKRATRLVVHAQLVGTGEQVIVETDAFEARALQHEIDHCQGLVFLDRVAHAHAIFARKTYL